MLKPILPTVLAFALVIYCAPRPVAADPLTIIDTFGPNDSYQLTGGYFPVTSGYIHAVGFEPSVDVLLDSISVALSAGIYPPFAPSVRLSVLEPTQSLEDMQMYSPDVLRSLESIPVSGMGTYGDPNLPITGVSTSRPRLNAGELYFFAVHSDAGNAGLHFSTIWTGLPLAVTTEEGYDSGSGEIVFLRSPLDLPATAFRITGTPVGTPVPEPSSLLLVAIDGMCLGGVLRARRRR